MCGSWDKEEAYVTVGGGGVQASACTCTSQSTAHSGRSEHACVCVGLICRQEDPTH